MTEQTKVTGLVAWVGYLGITVLLLLPLSVLTVRSGVWQQGLLLYAIACLGAAILLLLAALLLLLPKFRNTRRAIGQRMLYVVPGTVLLLTMLGGGGDIPPIHDITTDTANPPAFDAAVQARGEGSNSLETKPETVAQQLAAYPDLEPLSSALPAGQAFDTALAVGQAMGWEIIAQDKAGGIIEAVDTTAIMAFKDDVVIRITASGSGSVIDLRSVSRVGVSDLGANAKRIRAFIEQFNSAAASS